MDMLLSAGDSSFQEMLDLDIKNDIDSVLGAHSDFANFSFTDLPPLDIDDTPNDLNMWFSNTNSNHSNSNFNFDFIGSEGAAMMVNPNSVMPLTLVTVPAKSPSPVNITAFSPVLKVTKTTSTTNNGAKKSDVFAEKRLAERKPIKISSAISRSVVRMSDGDVSAQTKNGNVFSIKSAIQKQLTVSGVRVFSPAATQTTTTSVHHGRKQHFNNNKHYVGISDEKAYPKPAYSYSCLIAMALKNSRNGSLPVSEIYNFMCEHFPYFKTAPNGWKNSVRHNLSLNKCFEKIEKPAVSGAQRKGCLWAMNPDKISKMDEEVQKWSRKDPSAIRKAMIKPENLESLERGELKYTCRTVPDDNEDGYGDSSADTEEDEEEEEEENSDVEVEDQTELDEVDFVHVSDNCNYDIEVSDTIYEAETDDNEQNMIKIEMELIDDEILQYEDIPSKKRSRSILELDEDFTNTKLYQVQTPGRRKTAYLIKND